MPGTIIRKQAGYGLITLELLLAVTALGAMQYMRNSEYVDTALTEKAQRAGQQMATVRGALESYLAANYEILTDQISVNDINSQIAAGAIPSWKATAAIPRIGNVIDPNYGLCGDHNCTRVTVDDLITTQNLNSGFNKTNVFGHSYDIVIRREGNAGSYTLDALITTSDGIVRLSKGQGIYWPDAGEAAHRIGADGGVVRIATASDTAAGGPPAGTLTVFGEADKQNSKLGWWTAQNLWPNITKEGQLAARAGYFSNHYGSYIRRDGTLPWTGDQNAGDHQITNVKNIQWNAKVSYGDFCAKTLDGTAMPDDADDTTLPSGVVDSVKKNRFGAGSLALWKAPAGGSTNISSQMLSCLKNPDGTYRWAKPSGSPLTIEEMAAGMMDGWVTGPNWLCGVGYNTLVNPILGSIGWEAQKDFRSLVRFKIKHGRLFMQVWMGKLKIVPGGASYDNYHDYDWKDLDYLIATQPLGWPATVYSQTSTDGFSWPYNKPSEAPFTVDLPGLGQSCVTGKAGTTGEYYDSETSTEPLAAYATGNGYDPWRYGRYWSTSGFSINSSNVLLSWAYGQINPAIAGDGVNGIGTQYARGNAPVPTCVTTTDPISGISTTDCSGITNVPVQLPVDFGYITQTKEQNLSFIFYTREDPNKP